MTPPGAPGTGLPAAASVLAVCAHPDDESFGLGAVLHRFASAGAGVSVLCFTRGEASTLGPSGPSLAEVRAAELRAAADELGVRRVELFDHPDGALSAVPLEQLAREVAVLRAEVGADLLVVFDEGGVTGHPDHCRATEAAMAGAPGVPVLAWCVPRPVAGALNGEYASGFVGREDHEIDLVLAVDRDRQARAIARHTSQCHDNPVLWRRLDLLGGREALRWLRRPAEAAPADGAADRAAADRRRDTLAREWDPRYASSPRVFRAEPDETMVALVSSLRPGRAVDLGAGEGRNSLWLAGRGWDVVAVDASAVALARLSGAAADGGLAVRAVHDDVVSFLETTAASGERFDLAVLAYVHPEPGERRALFGAAGRALAPGGHLFVVVHHLSSLGVAGPPDPGRLYTEADLRAAVGGLEVLVAEERRGASDVSEPGTDLVLWARRPEP